MKRVGDLDINQDLAYEDREWTFERVGWVLFLVVLVAGAVGLFGHGPISWTDRATPDGSLEVSFERFGRRGGEQEIVVRADASAADEGEWQVDVSAGFVDGATIDTVSPEPDSVESVPGGVRYTFPQSEPDASLEAVFALTPQELWRHRGEISLAGGEGVTVSHFYFP